MSADIQLQQVPPRRGLVWLRQGLRVFAHRPMAFSLLLTSAIVGLFMVALIPVLGPLVSQAAQPLVWLGFMVATQGALRGQVPLPTVFLVALRIDRARTISLLQLCVLYSLALQPVWYISDWVAGGALEALLSASPQSPSGQAEMQRLMTSPEVFRGLFTGTALLAALSVPFWHAMALVHWGGHSVGKALFFSTIGVWRARWTFLVYGLASAAALFGAVLLCSVLLVMIGRPEWAKAFFMSLSLLFITVCMASLFFTFVDTFVSTAAVPEPERPPEPPAHGPT